MLKKGMNVRMSESFKAKLRGNCKVGKHIDGQSDEDCVHCSVIHVNEFGDCVGVVVDPVWPGRPDLEWNVRWQPSNLRYCYLEKDLILV